MQRGLKPVPMTIRRAIAFIRIWHRHHAPPCGGLWAVGCATTQGQLVGVAVAGRPVARMLQDGQTAEVTRLATDGTPNACSLLYGACWRAARALGYTRLITYILEAEPGVSLRAAGWHCCGTAGGGSWSRRSRPRKSSSFPEGRKQRWEKTAG
jgi:hypothetical protein